MNDTPKPNLPPQPDFTPLTSVAHPSSGHPGVPASSGELKDETLQQTRVQTTISLKKSFKRIALVFLVSTAGLMLVSGIAIAIFVAQLNSQFDGLTDAVERDMQTLEQERVNTKSTQ